VADTGGLREVVPHEEVGLRFRSRDPRSLAEVALRVLRDDELGRRLVAEAFEHVRSFDWADVAEQTYALYAELPTAVERLSMRRAASAFPSAASPGRPAS
jgi:glycosyltransferase involved in cell wall biosynthesis